MPLYTVYLDGTPTGGFQADTLGGFGNNDLVPEAPVVIPAIGYNSGSDRLYNIQRPNVVPSLQAMYPGVYGVDATVSRDNWLFLPQYVSPGITDIRIFVRTLRVRVRWDDTVNPPTTIPDRWVGGTVEWSGNFEWPYVVYNIARWGSQDGLIEYTLTDSTGIATLYAAVGIAVKDGGAWKLYSPANDGGRGFTIGYSVINPSLAVLQKAAAPFGPDYGPGHALDAVNRTVGGLTVEYDRPWGVDEGHYYRTTNLGHSADGGHGWGIDYGSAWNPATGILSYSIPALVDHDYHQSAILNVVDASLTPISAATVSFGPYSGMTDAMGNVTIPAIPRGSTAAPLLHPAFAVITDLEVEDASIYPASAGAFDYEAPAMKLIHHSPVAYFGLTYTGKTGNVLNGIKSRMLADPAAIFQVELQGGEPVTLPYTDFKVQKGAVVYRDAAGGDPPMWIFEDEDTKQNFRADVAGGPDNAIDGEGLDLHADPFGEPHLLDGREPQVWRLEGREMDRDFGQQAVMDETATSLSGVVLPDHRRLLHAIQGGESRLWTSDDAWDTDQSGTSTLLSNAHAYTKGILREGPDGGLHAWLVAGGQVYLSRSGDGGETWASASSVTTLPAQRDERGDTRHDGERWYRAHPEGSGLTLYSSYDGEEWASEGAISPDGSFPWLLAHPDGSLVVLYHDGAGLVSRTGGDSTGSWVWSSANPIAATDPTGVAGFVTGTKILAAWRVGKSDVKFAVSFDAGETWQDGSEG